MSTFKKQLRLYLHPISSACFILMLGSSHATPLNLSQVPAGNSGVEPAPNVIISVDNSGSMSSSANGAAVTAANPAKITALKNSLLNQFGNGAGSPGLIPDNRIRLAWQSMWVNAGGVAGSNTLTPGATNSMRPFSGAHRTNFATFVNALTANNVTPSHQMVSNVYSYMKTAPSTNSPWADNPGTAQATNYLACRRTYHVFMTDGGWNSNNNQSVGNADGTATTLGDGTTTYTPNTAQTRIYSDAFGGGSLSTLSDFSFRSWAEDLQTTMPNTIKPIIKQSGNETVGATVLQEFWNPKNDPATWQHITTHTIGFGTGATVWTNNSNTANIAPFWDLPSNTNNPGDNNYGGVGDYSALVNGTTLWPDPLALNENGRPVELWHMALNGRGKYYPARTNAALTAAFSDILDNILADTSKPLVSIAANSSSLKAGLYAYQAGYDAANWSGKLVARPIDGTTAAIGATESWNSATLLDSASFSVANRFVMSYSGTAGIEWKTYSSLPAPQQTPLNKNSIGTVDSNGQNRVDYLRGDRTKEASQPGGIFRNRGSRLGDIVNSNILYVGKPASGYGDAAYSTFRSPISGVGSRTPMVYVGANDGMLHGFDATSGVEMLAYIPQGVAQGDLRKLTDTTYTHQYFVDGQPFYGDAKIGATPAWKTVVVGSLAAGGKGYFALDATNPANFNAANALNLVIADTTATIDPDIGNIFTTPVVDDFVAGRSRQIVRLNNGNTQKHRWAVVLGNGYNSTNEAPVLVVQYLDGAKETKKISPCMQPISGAACSYKGGNGLSTPQLIDLNGDGIVDVAYAGDLLGNVWKFDLSSQTDSSWNTSFGNQPFFKSKPGESITTAPYWMQHPKGGVMLSVSTGRNLTTADQSTTDKGTVYGLWDSSSFTSTTPITITDTPLGPINTTSSATLPVSLVEQVISPVTFADGGVTYYTSTTNAVNYTATATTPAKRGWYMNWTVPGQRVLQNSKAYDGEKVLIKSTVPNSAIGSSTAETCTPGTTGERSFTFVLNMFTGNPSKQPVFDITAGNTTSHPNTAGMENNPAGDTIELRTDKGLKITPPCPKDQTCSPPKELKFGNYVGARANWREKQ